MSKINVSAFVSLDGVMQAPGGPEEDPTGGFTFGGWTVNYWDEGMGAWMGDIFEKPFALLLGRKTYDIFASHWPYSNDEPIAGAFNNATKYVATRNPDLKLDWQNSETLGPDVVGRLKELKRKDGPDLLVQGSSNFVQTLHGAGLVDTLTVIIFPLVLGRGKKLFGDGASPAGMKLVGSDTSSTGVIWARYERGGDIVPGSFALEQPSEAEIARRASLS